MAQVEVTESWIKDDVEGNGFAEWWRVFTVGNNLLYKEKWDDPIPFASFCFFPIPHKFYGLSVYDKLRDYYRTATALLRSEVDMRLQQNTFRIIADPRTIDQRDLQSGRPGIIKASKGFDPNAVMPIPTPAGAGNTMQILQYLDQEIYKQLGIDVGNGAISSDVEKSGNDAAKTSMVIDNSSAKVEMYAREFAEVALKPVVWAIINLLAQHKDDYSVKQLVESITPGVPLLIGEQDTLNIINRSDLTAKVGLGHLNSQQKAQGISAIKQEQMMLEQSGVPIGPQHKLAVSNELAKAMGYENVQDFFPTMEEVQQFQAMQAQAMQQQQAIQAQAAQMQMAQVQADLQYKQSQTQKNMADIQDKAIDNQRDDAKLAHQIQKDNVEAQIEIAQRRPVSL